MPDRGLAQQVLAHHSGVGLDQLSVVLDGDGAGDQGVDGSEEGVGDINAGISAKAAKPPMAALAPLS